MVECGTFLVHSGTAFCANDADEQVDAYGQMANRVWLQMRTIAATDRVRSVGVTWSDDAEREALVLRKSLADAGLDNVVAVGQSDAGHALATASGYEKTAVCVIEPEVVTAFAVDTHGAPKIAKQVRGNADSLIRWLTEFFDRDAWHAEGLVVAGSDSDRDAITSQLKQGLPVPVFTPAQALSALALGAARASTHGTEFTGSESAPQSDEQSFNHRRPWSLSHTREILLAGVLALVVFLSLGVGPPLVSNKRPGPAVQPQVANTSGGSPAGQSVAPPVATPVQQLGGPSADTPLAPAPAATPPVAVDVSPPAGLVPESPAGRVPESPARSVPQPPARSVPQPPARSVPEPPGSLPTAAPAAPAPQQPAAPTPQQPAAPPPPVSNQAPPAVPEPPTDSPPAPRSNCVLLCGFAL
jgi:hypothetical protein